MKTQNSLIEEDYQFETLQKTNQNKRLEDNNNFFQSSFIDIQKLNMKRRQSCLATANRFVKGFVNELKETINIDDYDNIFKEQMNQNKPKVVSKRISMFKNFKNPKNIINTNNKNSSNLLKKTMTINKNQNQSKPQLLKKASFMKENVFKRTSSYLAPQKKVNSTNALIKKSSLRHDNLSSNIKRFSKVPSIKNVLFINQNLEQNQK